MKIKLNDNAATVITSIDTEIKWYCDFKEDCGYFAILEINGMKLVYDGKDYSRTARKDFNKLINKGARKVWHAHTDEQERAHIDALNKYGLEWYCLAGEHSNSSKTQIDKLHYEQ